MARLPPALQLREFRLVWLAILAMSFATQMVAVALVWPKLFPSVAKIDRMEDLRPVMAQP